VEIAFATRQLRALCEDHSKAVQELGQATADELKRRLADLRAAESLQDLVASPPAQCDDPMEMSVATGNIARLILRCNHARVPRCAEGAVDWTAVERIKIMRVQIDG
jgi:hypothetical protein